MEASSSPAGQCTAGQASASARPFTNGPGRFGRIVRLGEVDSTNSVASALAADGAAEGLVVVADAQTAGRGRRGRRWVSYPGGSLTCSVLLRPERLDVAWAGFVAMACVALAAREAAEDCFGVTCGLKWPNDLVVGASKVAGILAEAPSGGGVVVGIGCNLASPAKGGLPDGATSLEEVSGGRSVGRDDFLLVLLGALERRFGPVAEAPDAARAEEASRAVVDEARAASATLGRRVAVELPSGGVLVGRAVALGDDGRLVVDDDGGARHVIEAGDVVHLRHGEPG